MKGWIGAITSRWTIPNIAISDIADTQREDAIPFLLSTWIGFGSDDAFISIGVDVALTYDLFNGGASNATPWVEVWYPDSPGPTIHQLLAPTLDTPTFPDTVLYTSPGDQIKATITLQSDPAAVQGIEGGQQYAGYVLTMSNITQNFDYSPLSMIIPQIDAIFGAWVVEPSGPSLSNSPVLTSATFDTSQSDAPLFPHFGHVFFDESYCFFASPDPFGFGILSPIEDGAAGFVTDQHGTVLARSTAITETCIRCWSPVGTNEPLVVQIPGCMPDTGPKNKKTNKRPCSTPNGFAGFQWLLIDVS